MSTKTSKRRQKRLNTNEQIEEMEIVDNSPTPKKTDESNSIEIIVEAEDLLEDTETKADTTEEQNGHPIEENGQNGNHEENNCVGEETTKEKLEESEKSITNQDSEVLFIEESSNDSDIVLSVDDCEGKEVSDHEKSPVLTGMTTRSHKASPKADKTENGMDTKITNEVRVNITRIGNEKSEEKEIDDSIQQEENKNEDNDEKDTTNASIFVNLGNDTTRNVDTTTTSVLEDTISHSFVEVNKDISYGQALRTLSGRRTLRRDSPFVSRFGKSHLEKDTTDARKSYIPHISSVKRKGPGELSDDAKRFKTEESPGLLSYISSPINSFRNKLSRSEIPSSTPKLMSYNKYGQGNNIIDDMSHIDIEEKNENKKWCSIM